MASSLDIILRDLQSTYRPQREWIEGRGLLIVLAHFFTGVGAGTWLFSRILDFQQGYYIGLGIVAVLGGLAHLTFLGHPERAWRMIFRPHSSWISRGLVGIAIFMTGGLPFAVYSALRTPHDAVAWTLSGVAIAGVAIIMAYKGFLFAFCRAIPFWHSPLLPALFIAYAARGGAAILLLAAAAGGEGFFDVKLLDVVKLWIGVSTAVLVLAYLVLAPTTDPAARRSVKEVLTGRVSPYFYVGTVALGLVVPIVVSILLNTTLELERTLLALVGATSLVGDFYIKYSVVRAGIYLPLVTGIPLAATRAQVNPAVQA